MKLRVVFFHLLITATVIGCSRQPGNRSDAPSPNEIENASPGAVLFSGGYETNPVDHGRPVALIASALGVEPQVFRDVFRNVKPAQFGSPTPARARANKKLLMEALGKYGITNERLDEVSDYYRYRREAGEVWTRTPATATAVVTDGQVTGFRITNPGSGYVTPPVVILAGHRDVEARATLGFTEDLRTNGHIAELTVVSD